MNANAANVKMVRLGDIAKVISGYAFKSNDFKTEGVPVIKIKNIRVGYVDLSEVDYIDPSFLTLPEKYHVKGGDLLISLTGSHLSQPNSVVGRVALHSSSLGNCLLNQRAGKIILKNADTCDQLYLFYVLYTQEKRREIAVMAAGAASQANVSPTQVESIEINLPPLETQRKIASILSAYDGLIENNTRRIKILEEMARMIYREWFVNFCFPGHEQVKMVDSQLGMIPEGWEVRELLDLSEVTYGFAFKADQFSVEPSGKPVVRIRDVLEGRSSTYSTEKPADKYFVQNGDVLVGMDGDFHMGFWVGGEAYLVQRVARFRSKGDISNYHLFLAMEKPIQDFNATITGTTVAHLGDKHIKTIQVAWPDKVLLTKVNQIFDPLLKHILKLRLKNQNLRQTRDLLLPKLISGEVAVVNAGITESAL